MPEITMYNQAGAVTGTLELPEAVFGVEPSLALMHQAVRTEEANSRQGTASTKTRANVRGGGRKPWKQKGTGRARQGSIRAPHWYHGGVVFGPHPRSYELSFPKQMRRGALRSALSAKVADGEIIGIDTLALSAARTREIANILKLLPLTRTVSGRKYEDGKRLSVTRTVPHNVLLIVPQHDQVLITAVRNLPNVTLRYAPNFSVRDILVAGRVVLVRDAVAPIEAVLGK